MTRRNCRPDRRRVKVLRSYTIDEVARTLEVHRNTVRHWIKAGLPIIDDKRPILMLGSDLADFLSRQRDARRQPCQAGQMFCLKCRKPQEFGRTGPQLAARTPTAFSKLSNEPATIPANFSGVGVGGMTRTSYLLMIQSSVRGKAMMRALVKKFLAAVVIAAIAIWMITTFSSPKPKPLQPVKFTTWLDILSVTAAPASCPGPACIPA